jgi:hypothetical protein
MTIYTGPTQASVLGQQISPFFGVQAGGAIPASVNPIVAPVPLAATIGGTQKTVLEACARGELPRNAQLATIAGQSVSVGISALQGDGVSVDEAFSSGNGVQVNLGVAVAPNAGNNSAVTTAGINTQVFVDGVASANDGLSTGPTPFNIESVVSAPLPGSTTLANVSLLAGVYQG